MKNLSGTLALAAGAAVLAAAGDATAFKIVSYNGSFTRWEKPRIHYVVDSRGSKDFEGDADGGCDSAGPCVSIRDIVRDSFETWSKTAGVDVDFVEDAPAVFRNAGYDGKNSVLWVESNWQGQSFSPPPGALAVTITTFRTSDNTIVDSDTFFNGEYFHWAAVDTDEEKNADVIDVQNIATHEFGHFIGLDHSSEDIFEPNSKLFLATMFFASGPGEIFRRNLGEDDRLAMLNLYPAGEPSEPLINAVEPSEVDAATSRTTAITIRGRNFKAQSAVLLAVAGDRGDVAGRVTSVTPEEIRVSFDATMLPSGRYDVVVANAYDRVDRVKAALAVTNGFPSAPGGPGSEGYASTDSGGCAGRGAGTLQGLFLLLFPVFLIASARPALHRRPKR